MSFRDLSSSGKHKSKPKTLFLYESEIYQKRQGKTCSAMIRQGFILAGFIALVGGLGLRM